MSPRLRGVSPRSEGAPRAENPGLRWEERGPHAQTLPTEGTPGRNPERERREGAHTPHPDEKTGAKPRGNGTRPSP